MKAACSSATRVDSADAGKNEALSFSCTSLSRPDSGPAAPLMRNQATTTAIAPQMAPRAVRRCLAGSMGSDAEGTEGLEIAMGEGFHPMNAGRESGGQPMEMGFVVTGAPEPAAVVTRTWKA